LPLIAERVTRTLLDVTYCTKFALFLIFYILLLVRSGAVVWGTARVRFPTVTESTQPLTEMSTMSISWG